MKDTQTKMENNHSNPKSTIVSLSEVPPLDPNNVSNLSSKFQYNEARKASNSTIAQTLNLKVEDASLGKISTRRRKKTKTDRAKESDSKSEGCERRPKSMLHEICAAKRWKPPLFECCEEGGPSHMKLFTFKVIIEVKDKDASSTSTIVECFSAPQGRKKTAADHAAEGALWYLKHLG